MADVVTKTRTNYFRTTDIKKLRDLLDQVKTDGSDIVLVESAGTNTAMFYCNGEIEGILTAQARENLTRDPNWADNHPETAYSIDAFLSELASLIVPGDACIIKTVGYESMRCIFAGAHIIAGGKVQYESFDQILLQKTRAMLADPTYTTCMN